MGALDFTGRTRAGHPSSRWKMMVPQPGRRDVLHMLARKGEMPVKRRTMRFVPMSIVGLASHRARVWADSERSLWASR
jgi:hypothetical protein